MNGSLEIILLFVLIATVTRAQDGRGESENQPDYDADHTIECLTEKVYLNISSRNTKDITNNIKADFSFIKGVLESVATKDSIIDTNLQIHVNQFQLQTSLNQTNVTLASISTDSKEIINVLNAITENITDNVKEHLDVYSISITDKLFGIRNETTFHFDSINKTLTSLALQSATDDIMAEIKKLATLDIIKGIQQNLPTKSDLNSVSSSMTELLKQTNNEILLNIVNDTNRLEEQLSSIIVEQEAIKVLIKGIESSPLSPAEDKMQTDEIEIVHTNEHICNLTESISKLSNLFNTSKIEITTHLSDKKMEIMESLEKIMELVKKQGNDKTSETAGQHSEKPSKRTFEIGAIIGSFCAVCLVILFVLVCVVLKRMGNLQSKLEHIQIQVAHEKYYKRDNSVTGIQLPKYEQQKNGKENLKINMYEDTELTENLMPKHES